jgi:cell division ATPase FtsA
MARPASVDGLRDIVEDPSYGVAIGLVLWGLEQEGGTGKKSRFSGEGEGWKKAVDWFKNFLP